MAAEDPEAQAKVIESAKALADICSRIRGERGIKKVQGFLVPVVRVVSAPHPPKNITDLELTILISEAAYDERIASIRARASEEEDEAEQQAARRVLRRTSDARGLCARCHRTVSRLG